MKINEIFQSIEGEGSCAGLVSTFIRIYGCNLRCDWCDSMYAVNTGEYTNRSISDILNIVDGFRSPNITLTGGEPLLDTKEALELISELSYKSYIKDIHIETNGSINLRPYEYQRKILENGEKIRFIVDYKLDGSFMNEYMIAENYSLLNKRDEIKFVISDINDLTQAFSIINSLNKAKCQAQILLSPVWGKMPFVEIVEELKKQNMPNTRLSLQLHKIIWDPSIRGV